MRYTWIDGIFKEVAFCGQCPFYSTEMELAGYCKYPINPANNGAGFKLYDAINDVLPDCPLRKED